jgi:NDP-sugar pyrophosphorylase family protein
MVLAAGLGTRLRPLTDAVPKALLDVGGRPMIEYALRMLAAVGVEEVVVNLHHLGEMIRSALGSGQRYRLRIRYSPEDPILDTGGAIARARPLLGDETFFVVNCDALVDPDLSGLAAFHQSRGALATLLVRKDPRADRYGAIDIDPRGRIRRFLGRPGWVEEPLERRMFCGVHVISPEIFERMAGGEAFSITRDTYASLIESGAPLYGFPYDGYWRDLGTAVELDAARKDVQSIRFSPGYLRS